MKTGRLLRSITAAASALVICAASAGCSVEFGTNPQIKDSAVVAAPTSGDADKSMKITYGDFSKQYDYILKLYGIDDDTNEYYADACTQQRELIINNLVTNQIILHKAKELGLDELTETEEQEVQDSYNTQIEQQIEYFISAADFSDLEEDAITDEIKRERGEKKFDEFLDECGMTRDDILQWSKEYIISAKVLDEVTKEITMQQAEETTAGHIAKLEAMYKEDPYSYETSGMYELWVPDGSRLIKHVLLGFDESLQTQIAIYRNADDDENANALRDQGAAELEEKIAEVQQKLDEMNEGKITFNEIILEYSADSAGSSAYPDGYLVVPDGEAYMEEFQQAAFVPENIGDRTTCVTDYGVHIMIYSADAEASQETIDAYVETAYGMLRNEKFQENLEQWKLDYSYEIDREALRLDGTEQNSSDSSDASDNTSSDADQSRSDSSSITAE